MNDFTFSVPQNIMVGRGSLAKLPEAAKQLGGSHAFIISGPHLTKMGLVGKVSDSLKAAGFAVDAFTETEGNPSTDTVEKAAAAYKASGADFIVAFGGGSPMDVAKAVGVVAKYGGRIEEYEGAHKVPGKIVPLIAIPTTAGTGSEVTAFSVITDYSTGIKYPLADFEITPDVAVLDTDIPQTMPKTLTAHTGMDALTHAFEAYVAARSEFSDPLALQAISSVFDNLIDSYHGDKEARGAMHIAQCLAGMAFSNALLGIAHSLAHKTGAIFHIPHGCCNAILLPSVIQFNSRVCMSRYAQIARALGLPGATDKQLTDSLVEAVRAGYRPDLPGERRVRGRLQGPLPGHRPQRGAGSLHSLQSPSGQRRGDARCPDLRVLRHRRHLLIAPPISP